jgi:hypothetical protein
MHACRTRRRRGDPKRDPAQLEQRLWAVPCPESATLVISKLRKPRVFTQNPSRAAVRCGATWPNPRAGRIDRGSDAISQPFADGEEEPVGGGRQGEPDWRAPSSSWSGRRRAAGGGKQDTMETRARLAADPGQVMELELESLLEAAFPEPKRLDRSSGRAIETRGWRSAPAWPLTPSQSWPTISP